jgi:pyruvate carboxylase
VQTNIDLLIRLLEHPVFSSGDCRTTFIDSNAELWASISQPDSGRKLLRFLGDAVVNGSRIQGQMVSITSPFGVFSCVSEIVYLTFDSLLSCIIFRKPLA